MKKRYVVTFYKTISSDYGEDKDILQGRFEVFADSEETALEEAKAEFCRRERLHDWMLHANRCEVEQPDPPS